MKSNSIIKNVSYICIILNLASILLAIIYLAIPIYSIIWDITGVIIIITLICNILLVHLNSTKVNRTSKEGSRLNLFCYLFLIYTILAMFGILFGNLIVSVTYVNFSLVYMVGYLMVFLNFFGLLAFGLIFALYDVKNLNNEKLWDLSKKFELAQTRKMTRGKKLLKRILKLDCYFTLAFGILFCYAILNGSADYFSGVVGVFIMQFAVFGAFMYLSATAIFLKLKDKNKNPRIYYAIAFIGLTISGIFMVPICLTNSAIYNAEKSFAEAFGSDWRDDIPADVEKYFLKTPFSLPGYFLGIPPKDCEIEIHQKFFEDDEVELYYDAYMPLDDPEDLPGEGSILIRIHGGGWVFGDKGWGDMMQMNKYFAAQGYIVFDIQYRLRRISFLDVDPLTPKYRKGSFDMDYIIDSLGEFTKYLADNIDDYEDANLDSVFVSGGSAGGHLTCVMGLGIASGDYEDIFGTALTIKGIIPFYPGNGIAPMIGVDGTEELVNPELLVDEDSPPCLIYHGTNDGLVHPSVSVSLRDKYIKKDNDECAIIWLPLSGHANDIYFSGHYNQVFLYYMERFLYLYH